MTKPNLLTAETDGIATDWPAGQQSDGCGESGQVPREESET